MIKAVVFDFDGLIIDTEYALYESLLDLLKITTDELPIAEYAKYIGSDSDELFDLVASRANGLLTREEIIEQSHHLHKQKLQSPIARDGVEEYLRDAKEMGLKIGLASSSYRAWVTHFLKELNLLQYFDEIQTRDNVERVKPDPALYQNVVGLLGVNPSEAIAFEDSGNGSKAALAAGLNCVIVPNPITKHLEFENYHMRLTSMKEKKLSEVIAHFE